MGYLGVRESSIREQYLTLANYTFAGEMKMTMTKEERVLRVIDGKDVDYLPSHITFSDRTRDKEISEALELGSADELEDYLENHLHLTLSLHDKPLFYRNDKEEMQRLQELGFCGTNWPQNMVYDSWGMGVQIGSDGFFAGCHPLSKSADEQIAECMPPDVNRQVLFQDVEDAVQNYSAPDLNRPGLFDEMKRDLACLLYTS